MSEELSQKAQMFIQKFLQLPPDYDDIEKGFIENHPSQEELADIAAAVTDASCLCYKDGDNLGNYLCSSIAFLLQKGLDPNQCGYDGAALWILRYVDNPGVAGKVLQLLIENGGLVNEADEGEEHSLYECLEDEVMFEIVFYNIDQSLFDCWLVCSSYGGKIRSSNRAIKMVTGEDIRILRDFERFYHRCSWEGYEDDNGKHWIEIFDKNTDELIAVY